MVLTGILLTIRKVDDAIYKTTPKKLQLSLQATSKSLRFQFKF